VAVGNPPGSELTITMGGSLATVVAAIIGVVAYAMAFFFDWVALKNTLRLKAAMVVVFLVLQFTALIVAVAANSHFERSIFLLILGWIILPVACVLLYYSLIVELPAGKTYIRSGVSNSLVKTGTYALTRHPHVIWYLMGYAALVLITGSWPVVIAGAVWCVLKILYAVVEDRLYFVKMFAGYVQYQKETPMFVPNKRSLEAFVRTFNFRPQNYRTQKV